MAMKLLIVSANFYSDIAKMLEESAIDFLKEQDVAYDILQVPGCLEIPAVISFAQPSISSSSNLTALTAEGSVYDGYVALGCVIRGQTSHYDIVCNETARGLSQLALQYNIAIGNGVLTVENKDQAIARADKSQGNKGKFASNACLELIKIKQRLSC